MPDNDKNDRRRSGPDGPSGPGIPRTRLTPWILIALVVLALVAFNQWFSTASRQSIDLSRFYQLVDEGKITPGTKVTISATQVTGTYTADDGTQKSFVATLPGSNYDPSTTLEPKLQAKGESFRDFVIVEEKDRGLPGFYDLIGIESPGLTAAPAIAEHVARLIRSDG